MTIEMTLSAFYAEKDIYSFGPFAWGSGRHCSAIAVEVVFPQVNFPETLSQAGDLKPLGYGAMLYFARMISAS